MLLSGEICLLADLIMVFSGHPLPGLPFVCAFVALSALFVGLRMSSRARWLVFSAVAGTYLLLALLAYVIWKSFLPGSVYQEVDNGKELLFGGKKVMLVVPHQDDDQNVLGGVIEQYIKYGSEVWVVFVTTGDSHVSGEIRMTEAIRVLARCGILEEHIIFLGYGDRWNPAGAHIYHAQPDTPLTSFSGQTQTYGPEGHPAYRDGKLYTRRNLLEDLRDVILEYEPDVLFACDFDGHIDHRSASLFFEEAMGLALSQRPDYTPLVLKGFAYSTAFYNGEDYYFLNLRATGKPYDTPYMQESNIYNWDERLRLPVEASLLSRSLFNSELYIHLQQYITQEARLNAMQVINGDKVFWHRDTSSLSYTAQVNVSSGEAWRLHDFKLADSIDIGTDRLPFDATWVPEAGDEEKSAEILLAEPSDIAYISLYDNPSVTDNVLDARISFDDGTQIHTGPLAVTGCATEIQVGKKNVGSFTVSLLETEGELAGLTEIEVYSERHDYGLRFIKLQNADGDFVYDYYIDKSGGEDFTLYAVGVPEERTEADYTVLVEGEGCSAQLDGGRLHVECPRGKSCVITVASADGTMSDSVRISNPGLTSRLGQRIEYCAQYAYPCFQQTATYRVLRDSFHFVRDLL